MQAGIILGPTILGQFEPIKDYLFLSGSQDELGLLGMFGFALFMFLSGVKNGYRDGPRNRKKSPVDGNFMHIVAFSSW